MSSDLTTLHKILKDQTRRKILRLIEAKGALTYTDLMTALSCNNTGTLNYHLKILCELLEKNDAGQYVLSAKGKAASRLLVEFPEPDYSLQAKRSWWRRFWFVAVTLDGLGLFLVGYFYFIGYLSRGALVQGIFGFVAGIAFLYFFYRMIRPVTRSLNKPPKNMQPNDSLGSCSIPVTTLNESNRTVQDILVFGRTLEEVKAQIQYWINQEGITLEAERDDYVRGRLGIPSGLGLTAPKYFEVTLQAQDGNVKVHTEGWISVYDLSELSFTNNRLAMGSIPRRKGWQVINRLWTELKTMSK
ncbi:MAG: winged helix-turn-helix domain-containing protein [Candidatus Bathyarchaeota archaeon]|nr:winged helix-turn-helix domain-containing protein [Candidatus Bathyarchaeota archaeon]